MGYLEGTKPVIIVRDPDLVKHITVRDFDSFMSRQALFPVEIFPLLGRGLVSMKGGKLSSEYDNFYSSFALFSAIKRDHISPS